jgi:Ankyrin repeats (3 copies)
MVALGILSVAFFPVVGLGVVLGLHLSEPDQFNPDDPDDKLVSTPGGEVKKLKFGTAEKNEQKASVFVPETYIEIKPSEPPKSLDEGEEIRYVSPPSPEDIKPGSSYLKKDVEQLREIIAFEDLGTIEKFLKEGGDVNAMYPETEGLHCVETLLHKASDFPSGPGGAPKKVVKLLLENGADVKQRHIDTGNTPWDTAVLMSTADVLKLFLEHSRRNGIELANEKDPKGVTPLERAVANKQIDKICLLVEYGADLTQHVKGQQSLKEWALKLGSADGQKVLDAIKKKNEGQGQV